jgi:hypothetical protein
VQRLFVAAVQGQGHVHGASLLPYRDKLIEDTPQKTKTFATLKQGRRQLIKNLPEDGDFVLP